jgi:hypothetical protein
MKVARPILVMRFPLSWKIEEIQKALSTVTKTVKDEYFIFTFKCPLVKTITFEVHNVENATTVELEDLRKKLLELKQ